MLMDARGYSVSELARASGVTVRTLHHYDAIGLLAPSGRSEAGYRVYSEADARRLADVLTYRACGVPLAEIAGLLAASGDDRRTLLERQLALLDERGDAIARQRDVLMRELEDLTMGTTPDPRDRFVAFGDFDPAEYEQEAAERWGETEAYRESTRRTSRYTDEDWRRERAESEAVETEFAACLDAGLGATDARAKAAAERHRQHIDLWFYPCSYELQCGLADMYLADERFTRHYEQIRPGLAAYVNAAIWANATDQAS